MLNLYSCGCIQHGDVPVLSRCEKHNCYLVGTLRNKVAKRRSFRVDDLRIRHHPLSETLETLQEKRIRFDLICSYPEHDPLHAYNALESGWHTSINPMFVELNNVLAPEGHMLLVVEQTLLAKVVYDCLLSGFTLNSISIVSSPAAIIPLHVNWPEFYVYKFAILLSKKGSGITLPGYLPLAKVHKRLKKLFEPRSVLDTSCIHNSFLSIADKTIGVCEDEKRYIRLKRELCKN